MVSSADYEVLEDGTVCMKCFGGVEKVPSVIWQDHQNLLAGTQLIPQVVMDAGGKRDFFRPVGRQPPVEWLIYQPEINTDTGTYSLRLFCLLCNQNVTYSSAEHLCGTGGASKVHRNRLEYFKKNVKELRRLRWDHIRRWSPICWGWSFFSNTDIIQNHGLYTVYLTLWPEEQFAVRYALHKAHKILLRRLDSGVIQSQYVDGMMTLPDLPWGPRDFSKVFSLAEQEAIFDYYKGIIFGTLPNRWDSLSDKALAEEIECKAASQKDVDSETSSIVGSDRFFDVSRSSFPQEAMGNSRLSIGSEMEDSQLVANAGPATAKTTASKTSATEPDDSPFLGQRPSVRSGH